MAKWSQRAARVRQTPEPTGQLAANVVNIVERGIAELDVVVAVARTPKLPICNKRKKGCATKKPVVTGKRTPSHRPRNGAGHDGAKPRPPAAEPIAKGGQEKARSSRCTAGSPMSMPSKP